MHTKNTGDNNYTERDGEFVPLQYYTEKQSNGPSLAYGTHHAPIRQRLKKHTLTRDP